jgi:hypothetical protein
MRVPPIVVVMGAVILKVWLWWRTLPLEAHHIFCIVALWFLVAVMAAMWIQRTETYQPHELYCRDEAQKWDMEERCELKLRNARLGHSALKRHLIA